MTQRRSGARVADRPKAVGDYLILGGGWRTLAARRPQNTNDERTKLRPAGIDALKSKAHLVRQVKTECEMIRIYPLALLAFAFLVGGPLSAGECVERTALPSNVPNTRAQRAAECSYDFNQLVARITELAVGKEPYTVETVEKILGLPKLTTDFDDQTKAVYSMDLSGKNGWRGTLNVQENFPDPTQQPRFVPGLRPKRLYKIEAAELIVQFDFHNSQCVPLRPLRDFLGKSGWSEGIYVSYHGEVIPPAYIRGRKQVAGDDDGTCAKFLQLRESDEIAGTPSMPIGSP
jgi:hypothetical protein